MPLDLQGSDTYEEPYSICSPSGELDQDRLSFDLTDEFLRDLYRDIWMARLFDRRAINLQRQGKLGTYAPCEGQEACQIAAVEAIETTDPLFPTYRETAALISRGIPLVKIFQYWSGDERGSQWSEDRHVFPISIPVGSQGLHGVGAARAFQVRDEKRFPVTFFGDGATSEGDLLEALNFAGVWETPMMFFCQNNQWAISVPREKQTASDTLAQKAEAFGFRGFRVDGNDPIATYQLVRDLRKESLERGTPVFVEAMTYRFGDHTTSDDADRYRDEDEVERWRQKDAVKRLRRLLESRCGWTEEDEESLQKELKETIDDAIETFEQISEPEPEDIFNHTFSTLPPDLEEQKSQLKEELDGE